MINKKTIANQIMQRSNTNGLTANYTESRFSSFFYRVPLGPLKIKNVQKLDSIFATTQYFQHGLRQNALSGGVCELAASACYRWCTGLGVRTKLLADLTTKESETILIKRMLFLTP
jgi:hypothetical protein